MTNAQPAGVVALEARGITKVFPGTTALAGVEFAIRRGSVHALIGENGAGKSTLVRILAGIEQPTSGQVLIDGRAVRFASVSDAARRGIALIHQELQLFPNLSIAENVFVGRERRTAWGLVDAEAQRRTAASLLANLGHPLDPGLLVGALPLGLRQIVAIARALVDDARVLMMDEPTSALTHAEVDVLFRVIRDLASRGVAVVYISHRLEELLEIAGDVTVLRDGRVVGASPSRDVDVAWIVERMTGRRAAARSAAAARSTGGPALTVRDLRLGGGPGRTALQGVSFEVRAGEILGVYGLMGAGRTELFEALLGVHPDAAGEIALGGRRIDDLPLADRVRAGIAMVPEDRQAAGLVQTLDVAANMTLSSLDRLARFGYLPPGRERTHAERLAAELRIKTPSITSAIGALSGGNQQKVVLSRAVMSRPRVLLLDEPTRGVDVGAKTEIVACAKRLAQEGMAVLYAASDLSEIFAVADRVLVLSRGRVTADGPVGDLDEEALASAASRIQLPAGRGVDARV